MVNGKSTKHTYVCTHTWSHCLFTICVVLSLDLLILCPFHWYTDNQRNWVASLLSFLGATDNNIKPEDWNRNVLICSKNTMKDNDLSEQADCGGGWSLKCCWCRIVEDKDYGKELESELDSRVQIIAGI